MNKTINRIMSFVVAFALTFGASSRALASPASASVMQERRAAILISNVYYVSTTGSDTNSGSITSPFKTFAKAVSVLLPGDTLQVMTGMYYETLTLSKSGTASAPITVIGNGAILNMQSSRQSGINISGSYINVSKFEITGATEYGILITGKNLAIENNVVHDNVTKNGIGTCGIASSWTSALKVRVGGENLTIRGNTVYNNCGEGIAVTRGVHTLVENNTAYDNYSVNIYVDNSPYTTVRNNLSYCTGTHLRDGLRATGIGLGEESYSGWGAQLHDILISGNTMKDCKNGVTASKSEVGGTMTNVTITKNSVPSAQLKSIALSTTNQNVVISYNTLFKAVYLAQSAGVTLIGNIIGTAAPTPTSISSPTSTVMVPTSTPTSTLPAPTATPATTSTPSIIVSNTPTSTPTVIASNPPVQSASDFIFADSFEPGNLSAWSSTSLTNGGNLSASPNAALIGIYGLQATFNNTTAMYVRDDSPNAEPRYRARFYFNPNSIAMPSGDYDYLLEARDASNAIILRIQFQLGSTGYQVRARAYDSVLANWVNTPFVTISNAVHVVEVDWGNDGHLAFWVDGVQQGSVTGINNSSYTIDSVRLGAPYMYFPSTTAISGSYFIDAFESRRQTYIGP